MTETTRVVPAAVVREHTERWLRDARRAPPTSRLEETTAVNAGLAAAAVR